MKAWQFSEFGGVDRLSVKEVSLGRPDADEVRIGVAYAAVNHVDRLVVGGRLKWVTLPHIPGAEYVGTVLESGSGADGIFPGDRVAVFPKMFCGRCRYCISGQEGVCLEAWNPERAPVDLSTNMLPSARDGGWAEETLIPARNLVKLPDRLDFRSAACLPLSAMTAHHMIARASLAEGNTALVVGSTGGVGTFLIQLLKLAGCTVVAVVNNPGQIDAVKALGADNVVPRIAKDVKAEVLELTGGYGADAVFDSLGASTFGASIGSLAPCGKYITAGTLTGPASELNLMLIYSRQLEIIGSTTGSIEDLKSVVALATDGKLKPVISATFTFDELKEAMDAHSKQGRLGKILLEINGA